MFGYITTNTPELKIKDYLEYHSYYCGLCRSLGRNHGQGSRLTLSYDMAFTAMLLTALYEPKEQLYHKRCPLHPGRKLLMRENLYTEYAADMNLILTYYKLMDDWDDEGKLKARAGNSTRTNAGSSKTGSVRSGKQKKGERRIPMFLPDFSGRSWRRS